MMVCPCCTSGSATAHDRPEPHYACPRCGHCWRSPHANGGAIDYTALAGRNAVPADLLQRKFEDRLSTVEPMLCGRPRILEVGCAEGGFGARVKALADVDYAGLEISRDAELAATRLDAVFTQPADKLATGGFDLLLAFHVLEHIADIRSELGHWRRLLAASGTMLIEVPHGAGHPLRDWDSHPEHRHFFTATSLSALLAHAGFIIESLSRGHYESPVYPDSLRVVARPELNTEEKSERLLARINRLLPGPFVIYGIGGDFRNCLLPILDRLPVVALVDSDPERLGEQVTEAQAIQAYDPARFAGLPILIGSLRHKEAIAKRLRAGTARLVGLDEILELD